MGAEGGYVAEDGDILGNGQLLKSIIVPPPPGALRPQLGDEVKVHFVGSLMDGKVFDDSRKRHEPYKFRMGLGHVIEGWDKGVATMLKGERSLFTIGPELAYGEDGAGWKIPKGASVRFDIELLDIEELDPMDEEDFEDEFELEEPPCGRDDVGPGGEDKKGGYTWERCGHEVVVTALVDDDVSSSDVKSKFLPRWVSVAIKGETLLEGTPATEIDFEECTWDLIDSEDGERRLVVHLQKRDADYVRWPSVLLEEDRNED